MQLVFLNTLEKQDAEKKIVQAQVSICEQGGTWAVLWTEGDDTGPAEGQSTWFEGTSWEEMIAAFRHGIAAKMGEGYIPMLDGMLEERRSGLGGFLSMLHCYGELNAQQDLFNALRDYRRSKAAEQKKAAYLVANNRMLWMISAFVPHTPDELLQIPGWGDVKNGLYGSEILAITQNYERMTAFPLQWVGDELDPVVYSQWLYKQKENKYKSEMERQQEKRRILSAIHEGRSLNELQSMLEIPRRILFERIEQLESEGYDLEPLLDRELVELPETEQEKIMSVLQDVGDRYLKPVLKEVYAEDELQGKPLDVFYDRLRLMRLKFRRKSGSQVI